MFVHSRGQTGPWLCLKIPRDFRLSTFLNSHFKTRPASAVPVWCDTCPTVWHRVTEVYSLQGVACDFPKPKQAIFLSFSLSFYSPFRLGRMQHHRPCHPELRGQQPYAFRPPLAFLGKIQPAGHFLSESLRDNGWDVAQAGVPLVLCMDGEKGGGREGERGRGRRVRRLGCQRGGGGMEERRDWHLHVHEAGQRRDSLMSLQATISRSCSDCSDGLVWWLGHQLSLLCSATFAVAGKEGNGGGKEALELHTHTCTHAHKSETGKGEKQLWLQAIDFVSWHLLISHLACFSAVVPSRYG